MSLLFVGDPHATVAEIPDLQKLIDGIIGLPYQTVVFLGDQFHTHSVLNLDVVDFWQRAAWRLKEAGKICWFLVGNHDMSTSGRGPHAMTTLRGFVEPEHIVDHPRVIADGIVAIPYCHGHEAFDKAQRQAARFAEDQGSRPLDQWTLVCHQTFAGAQYENGFYAPDGFPLDKLVFKKVISGHIHNASEIVAESGLRIKYVGSPRWRTASDAGQSKYLLAYPQGIRGVLQLHDTSDWCSPIEVIEDDNDAFNPLESRRWENSRLTVIVRGEPDRVRRRCAELQALGIAALPRPASTAAPRVSEQAPVMKSFQDFLLAFKGGYGTQGQRLAELVNGYPQWQTT